MKILEENEMIKDISIGREKEGCGGASDVGMSPRTDLFGCFCSFEWYFMSRFIRPEE
jgi:hypothetical protein